MTEEKYKKTEDKKINPLSVFLEKFKKILGNDQHQKEFIIETINKNLGFDIDLKREDLKITNNVLYLKLSPLVKGEVMMRKQKILEDFKDKNLSILEIR